MASMEFKILRRESKKVVVAMSHQVQGSLSLNKTL